MFLERARAVRPDFTDSEDVTRICTLLEGLPLALELAAARALSLSSSQIRHQLADRFAFLVSRRRDVPDRQRSLRAAIEWSIHLLSPPLLESLLRLCVFRGGFTEMAADAILTSKAATVDILEALRSHSLVHATFLGSGVVRYDLLVSLREFCLGRAPRALRQEAVSAHARYYFDLAERVRASSVGGEVADEGENFHGALSALAESDPDSCARMALALAGFWERRGGTATARFWFDRCLSLLPETSERHGPLLEHLGMVRMHLPDREAIYERGIVAYAAIGDREGVARLQHAAAGVALAQGEVARAKDRYAECLLLRQELAAAGGGDAGLASTMHMLAVSIRRLNPEADVSPLLDEAEARLSASSPLGLAFVLNTRRGHAWEEGDVARARKLGERVEETMLACGKIALAAHTHAWLALPALAEGDTERASACLVEAEKRVAGHDDPANLVFLWHYGGLVATHRGDYDEAFTSLCYARKLCGELENRVGELKVLRLLGNWHLAARGDARSAVRLWAAVESLQESAYTRLPAPERGWQNAHERQAHLLLGPDVANERSAGGALTLYAAVALATRYD